MSQLRNQDTHRNYLNYQQIQQQQQFIQNNQQSQFPPKRNKSFLERLGVVRSQSSKPPKNNNSQKNNYYNLRQQEAYQRNIQQQQQFQPLYQQLPPQPTPRTHHNLPSQVAIKEEEEPANDRAERARDLLQRVQNAKSLSDLKQSLERDLDSKNNSNNKYQANFNQDIIHQSSPVFTKPPIPKTRKYKPSKPAVRNPSQTNPPPIAKKVQERLPQVSSNGLVPTMKAVRSTSMLNKNKNSKNKNNSSDPHVQRAKSFCNFDDEINWWHHSIGSLNDKNSKSEKNSNEQSSKVGLKVPQPPPIMLEEKKKKKSTSCVIILLL